MISFRNQIIILLNGFCHFENEFLITKLVHVSISKYYFSYLDYFPCDLDKIGYIFVSIQLAIIVGCIKLGFGVE